MYGECALLLSTAEYFSEIVINKNANDQDLSF